MTRDPSYRTNVFPNSAALKAARHNGSDHVVEVLPRDPRAFKQTGKAGQNNLAFCPAPLRPDAASMRPSQ